MHRTAGDPGLRLVPPGTCDQICYIQVLRWRKRGQAPLAGCSGRGPLCQVPQLDALLLPLEATVVERMDGDVMPLRLVAQGSDRASLQRAVRERVERVPPAGVLVGDAGQLLVGHARGDPGQLLGCLGPRRIRVWVVAFPGDVVESDEVSQFEPNRVGDEAGQEVLPEDVAREPVPEVLAGPQPV